MDVAYDHIQGESFPEDKQQSKDNKPGEQQPNDFNSDVQDAFKAISNSPWAARIGGLWGTVRKQGEQYYEGARQEYSVASEQATKGITSIINRTRSLSVRPGEQSAPAAEGSATEKKEGEGESSVAAHPDRPESLPADIVKEAEGILSRFRAEATKRLKDIERAEDAADEALLKFGTNIQNFLRDAVTIAPPDASGGKEVLFESKDAEGRRVIHTSRLEAQLHVIHSNLDGFLKDPISPEWAPWVEKFDANAFTETISKDLEKFEELRRAMEKLVPEKVEYAPFWMRYYFLRHVIDVEEQKRKEILLKASKAPEEEEVAWDEDSDEEEEEGEEEEEEEESSSEEEEEEDDSDDASTPNPLANSKETLKPADGKAQGLLKPKPESPRRSNDQQSQAGSDASYDVVSGASSRAPGSPRDAKKEALAEESDEEDWE